MAEVTDLLNRFPAAGEYLSEVFFQHRENGTVTNRRLAERLHVSRPAVTQAMQRLARLGLVERRVDGTIVLSDDGRRLAERIVRRHFILEGLLVDLLGYSWDKSDAEADALHAGLSAELEEFLFEKLGRPTTCPHGNPIPGSNDTERILAAPRLTEIDPPTEVEIVRITEEGEHVPELLSDFESLGIRPRQWYLFAESSPAGCRLAPTSAAAPRRRDVIVPIERARFLAVYPLVEGRLPTAR